MAARDVQRIVMKFGGTAMAGTERIRRVANIVRAQAAKRGGVSSEVAVVVSAMAGETDELVALAHELGVDAYDPCGRPAPAGRRQIGVAGDQRRGTF